jgi:DNA-binding HxlR family transcriptional regulator
MIQPFRQRSTLDKHGKDILFYLYDTYWGKSFTLKEIRSLCNNNQFLKNLEDKGFVKKKGRVKVSDPTYAWELTAKAQEHIKAYRSGLGLIRRPRSY